jgi:hypothetical protein
MPSVWLLWLDIKRQVFGGEAKEGQLAVKHALPQCNLEKWTT